MATRDLFHTLARRMAVSGLRQNNERAVLSVVATAPGSSAAKIARSTGLGPQSVSRILSEFEAAGLIYRGELLRGQRGQPAVPIFLDPKGAYCIGCEIGWRHMHILLLNLGGQILGEYRADHAYPDAQQLLPEILDRTRQLIEQVPHEHRDRLLGMGLAMPSGIFQNPHLTGMPEPVAKHWAEGTIYRQIGEALQLEIFQFNDGNAGCWAEISALPSPRPANIAYLHVGPFVAAGLVAEGRLWEGPTGNSANLGSMIVCGRSGKQQFAHLTASIYALEQALLAAGKSLPSGAADAEDWAALEPELTTWLEDAGHALAHVIINTTAVMEFGVAVVDGSLPRPIVERLVDRVSHHLKAFPVLTSERPEVRLGAWGGKAAAFGAALKPMFRRLFSREPADLLD